MARPLKNAIDYFPMDVDFFVDPKIIMIEDKYKAKGIAIVTGLLCMVYRNGYFLPFNDSMSYVVAKRVGCEVNGALVMEVVRALIKNDFFDEGVFNRCQVLTSRGIQKRWERIIHDCKRKAVIDHSHRINSITEELPPEETKAKPELMRQRRGEEKKVNERKDDDGGSSAPASGIFESKKSLEELASTLSGDDRWIEQVCMKTSKSREDIVALIGTFKLHCETIKTGPKTETDFARHFLNWVSKARSIVVNGKSSAAGFPDHYDRSYESKLQGAGLSAYWAHLRSIGLAPKKNQRGDTLDWQPANQRAAS